MGFKKQFCKWVHRSQSIYWNKCFFIWNYAHGKGNMQGCLMSCLIFICSEFLALQMQQNDEIEGFEINIDVGWATIKVTQYSHDTCLFIKNPEQIPQSVTMINKFSLLSCLCLNLKILDGLCIGRIANLISNHSDIKWPKIPIRY